MQGRDFYSAVFVLRHCGHKIKTCRESNKIVVVLLKAHILLSTHVQHLALATFISAPGCPVGRTSSIGGELLGRDVARTASLTHFVLVKATASYDHNEHDLFHCAP